LTDNLLPRPVPLQVNFDAVPIEIRNLDQWVLWRYEWKGSKSRKPGKWDKPPCTPHGGHAKSTDSQSWISFEEAKTAYLDGLKLSENDKKHFDGIGFVPARDASSELQLTLIDLDKCRNPNTAEIDRWATEDLDLISSYSEISPSGTGIRIVAQGKLLPDEGKGRKKGHIEIYQTAHYLTITGQTIKDYSEEIESRANEINRFYEKHFGEPQPKEIQRVEPLEGQGGNLNDDEIIRLATNAANGDKFKTLMAGDIGGYRSESEADEAFCCIIAFYTKDEAQIERIWGRSGLARREKFQREDYRRMTIKKANKLVKEHYSGGISNSSQQKHKSSGKKSIAARLVALAKDNGCELWHSPEGDPYISFEIDGHRENHSLKSKSVKRWLGKLLYDAEEKAPNTQAMQDAINILEAEAVYNGHEYNTYVRVGKFGDAIYIDLCDDRWRAIEINASGWKITERPIIRFTRSNGMLPLPDPVEGGTLEDLKHILNIGEEKNWILIKAALVGALHPKGPYPITIFGGEQGSAKSTMQKIIRNLIDPNKAPLRLPPKDERDLMIAAKNSWIVSFDNLSGIRNDLSDALCQLSTESGFSTRELYTDTEETLLSVRRPVFLNGIDSISSRQDLLNRAIIIVLSHLNEEKRKTEEEIMGQFNRIHPGVLGALCNAISVGLKNAPKVHLERLPRMADFATWVTACEPGLECKPGSFLKTYNSALSDTIIDTISVDGLAQTIITIAEHNKLAWSGTATQLLSKINDMNGYNYQRPPMGWPQTASTLSNKLNRLAPSLRRVGVEIEFKKTASARIITIKRVDDGVTANDGELRKGRYNRNHIQENLNAFNRVHNDGDDGDLLSLSCEEGKEENKHKEKCDIKRESSDKMPSSSSFASHDNDCGPHIAVTTPSSFLSVDEAPKMGPHPRRDEPTPNSKSNMVQRANELVARLESEGKPIIGSEVMKELGVDYSKANEILTEAGLKMTTDKDEIMGFRIWMRS